MSPLQGLAVAAVAALLVWGGLQASLPVFEMPARLRDMSGNAPPEQQQEVLAAVKTVQYQDAVLSLTIWGFALGLLLASTEQLMRRRRARAVWCGLLAGLVSGGVSLGAGFAGASLFNALGATFATNPLVKTMLVEGLMFGLGGAGVGLAFSLAVFRADLVLKCAGGGALGGLLAALVYPLMMAVAFPRLRTEVLMPDPGVGLLLWLALPAGLVAVSVTGPASGKPASSPRSTPVHSSR